MKKVELLSPVGNFDMLYQAIHNGADAVYLAGTNYGARKFSNNFSNEELVNVFKYARLYEVKVYVTVNTLIYDNEVDDFIEYVGFLHKNGVDAVIMQDMGMIKLVRSMYPNLEVHASTQCHNHNKEIIKLWKSLGVTRVVMAREMSLSEINNIDVDIEKEVFVYGALCVCYSGCCLFSSLNGGRSGNRGECVGSCRLPYKLFKNDKEIKTNGNYLLSTRELNTIDNLKQLLDSNIDSLKIEGRMKSPTYVGYVTRLLRILIDKYYKGEELVLTKEERDNLKVLFNREFTNGYLFNDKNIMNIKTPNHQGLEIGEVISITKDKIKIKLTSDLRQNDGIRFANVDKGMIVNKLYNDKGLLVNETLKGNICYVDNKFSLHSNMKVLKTIDSKLIKELENISMKKIDVSMDVKAVIGSELELVLSDGINRVIVKGNVIEQASKRAVTEDEIIRQLSKLGNTPYKLVDIKINNSKNIFINLGNLNEIRRDAVSKLTALRENSNVCYVKNTYIDNTVIKDSTNKVFLSVLVRNKEQLLTAIDNDVDYIYITDYELYKKYKDRDNIYYRLDRIMNNYPHYENEKLLVGELGSIYKYSNNNELIGDYYLNITNHYSINFLNNYNIKRITLSVELDDYKMKDIAKYFNNIELIIYGRRELMAMKYCPLKESLNYCSSCKNNQDKFYLSDKFNNKYPLIRNNCITHILESTPHNKLNNLNDYLDMGIKYYRLELFDEDKKEIETLIKNFRKAS